MSQKQTPNYTFALIVVIAVCFLIGFVTTMNNSMIAFCKSTFALSELQGQLVNTAFYGMYAFSILLGMLMNKIGYKKTMIGGLAVVSLGFLLSYFGIGSFAGENGMIPASDPAVVQSVYTVFLSCMACVAIGIVMLQLVANPYVKELGAPETGAFRMTLSQAINSVATTVAPLFVGLLIVTGGGEDEGALANVKAQLAANPDATIAAPVAQSIAPEIDPTSITNPFLGLCLFVLLLCVILAFLKLPEIKEDSGSYDNTKTYKSSAFKYPHVWLGALAICVYMGLEIGIPSMVSAKIQSIYVNTDKHWISAMATPLLAYYWGGMMVGRFVGSAVLSKFQPRAILSTCLICGAICVGASFVLSGMASVYVLLVAGLFHSVMWPLIFNLGLEEVGPHAKTASGIINVGVIGGATLPLLMGVVVDNIGVGLAIGMMFIYYLYEVWFCWKGSKIGLK